MSLSNQTFGFSLNRAFNILRNGATLGLLRIHRTLGTSKK